MEKIEIRSLSLRASLVIQFRETPTAFVRNSARRNRAAFSSMYFITCNRRAVDEREKRESREEIRRSIAQHMDRVTRDALLTQANRVHC